ncbi:hypothetical protein BDZ91DRAFT_520358 [Kalaharituber pfeilii]|nr:hypothetical protein BDZ91DRAFT_520358 [Kalaharituber pfeilii]
MLRLPTRLPFRSLRPTRRALAALKRHYSESRSSSSSSTPADKSITPTELSPHSEKRIAPTHPSDKRITPIQISADSPKYPCDNPAKAAYTGIFNRGESSIYGAEQTRSGTHQEIVQNNPRAAFDPMITNPEDVKRSAGFESGEAGNPLEYSSATPEVSLGNNDDMPQARSKYRKKASGGSKRA